jgi:excisionase family DNA binding protein
MTDDDRLLTPEEVGPLLGVKPDTVRLWMRQGLLPGVAKIGPRGLLRMSAAALQQYMRDSLVEPPEEGAS